MSAVNMSWHEVDQIVNKPPPLVTPKKLSSYEAFVNEMKKKTPKKSHQP